MISKDKIMQENIKPVRLSEWKNKNKRSIEMFENAVKSANGTLIDFSENTCW